MNIYSPNSVSIKISIKLQNPNNCEPHQTIRSPNLVNFKHGIVFFHSITFVYLEQDFNSFAILLKPESVMYWNKHNNAKLLNKKRDNALGDYTLL